MPDVLAVLALLGAALVGGAGLGACAAPESRPAPALAPPLPYEPPRVDIIDYDVTLDLDHRARWIEGHVDVTFAALPDRPAAELVLDAVELQITRVRNDQGLELPFHYDGRRLSVPLLPPLEPGAKAIIGVDYQGSPRRGLYIVPPVSSDPGRPWHIWTQGQSQDTRYWVPVWDQLDDRATHTLRVTVDDRFITMAAGTCIGSTRDARRGRRTDTWRMDTPHPISLMTLVSGDLAVAELPGGPLPLPVVAESQVMPQALVTLAPTRDILDFLAQYTGRPYPFPKYAQCLVKEFTSGGMENISATTLLQETLSAPADAPQIDALDLVDHEAAHMWFGDLVGCRDWGHVWLNEGFASYVEALYEGRIHGLDALRFTMLNFQRGAVAAEDARSRPIAWEGWTDPDEMFDEHSYPGGASRLHLLAELLGPDVFQRGVQAYVAEHAGGIVVTDDLKAAMETASGSDLDRFFEQWVYGAGYPRFELRLAAAEGSAGPGDAALERSDRLLVTQTQGRSGERAVFRVPVTVAWSRGGVEQSRRVLIEQQRVSVELPGEGPLDWVRFDATTSLPATFDFEQSEAMWARQLAHAADGVTRLIAAQWFAGDPAVRHAPFAQGWRPAPDTRVTLANAARADALPAVRATALDALTALSDEEDELCTTLARQLSADADGLVREAAIVSLGRLGDETVQPLLVAATRDPNSAVATAALSALADRGYPGLLGLCQTVAARTTQYQLDAAIVDLVGDLEGPDAERFLLAAARSEPVPRVRAAALYALSQRPDPHDAIWLLMVESLDDGSFLVRQAAANVLGQQHDPRSELQLRARLAIENEGQVREALVQALR